MSYYPANDFYGPAAVSGHYDVAHPSYDYHQRTASHQYSKSSSYGAYHIPPPHHAHSRSVMYQYGGYTNSYETYQYDFQQQLHQQEAAAAAAAVTGGVSAVLDYDLDQMSRFISWISYGLMKKHDSPSISFENLVKSVLSATRLPKSTIMLSLMYLNQRFPSQDEDEEQEFAAPVYSENEVFVNLCIAFVLGNKFNDDNTFTNKSWAEATGLPIALVNKEERDWLMKVSWSLNNTFGYDTLDQCWSTWCTKYCTPVAPVPASLIASPAAYATPAMGHSAMMAGTPVAVSSPVDTTSPVMDPGYQYYDSPASSNYDNRHYQYQQHQPQSYYQSNNYGGWYNGQGQAQKPVNIWSSNYTPATSHAASNYYQGYAAPQQNYGCNYSSYNYGFTEGNNFSLGTAC
ncbi:hypothetical protein BABINDRAFT_160519 [Babjeviella inositovora NRRL Y-12698]|uniref:Cyclin N-terminal domain-containing protein n=1 Tax=Babjeviella inositovora NRRL Y-12698 TaxID=984486 RepID=A0A1E3QTU5_9ASCO|nr:uncharacterized protein BABINDRAFT_160519 [Babjeviella inositovora NRRL Y-12698]ODQ81115.1 hypothetical protein BABINDRAFT_160519 [Babjeviella inositovora NRRL Y-12698]